MVAPLTRQDNDRATQARDTGIG